MKPKQILVLLVILTWLVIAAVVFLPLEWKVATVFTIGFFANTAFIYSLDSSQTWRGAFNECALGWCVIGVFILGIGELV